MIYQRTCTPEQSEMLYEAVKKLKIDDISFASLEILCKGKTLFQDMIDLSKAITKLEENGKPFSFEKATIMQYEEVLAKVANNLKATSSQRLGGENSHVDRKIRKGAVEMSKNYAYLQWTSPIGNHNKFYEITENDDGSIDVNYGRVGQRESASITVEKLLWIKKSEKIAKGYQDLTTLHSQLTPTQDSRMMDELSYQKTDDEAVNFLWKISSVFPENL